MDATAFLSRFTSLIRHVILSLLVLLPFRHLFSLVSLRDLHLSLIFLLSNLIPISLPLSSSPTLLHFWIPSRSKSRSPTPRRPPLLLIHGFGGNAKWQFERQIRRLSRSFDLYIPDLVFFGRSHSSSTERSIRFQAACLIEAMQLLGVEKYSVAGISYGGFVAYRVAELAGEAAVVRVVIMTAGVCVEAEEMRQLAEREGRDVADLLLPQRPQDLMDLIRRSMYRKPNWVPAFFLSDFIRVMYKDRRKERVELLKELQSRGAGVSPLPILKQETLILWGDQDNVFPLGLAYKLQRHLGQKARLEVIKDAGHALQLEKPDIVNNMIEQFLLKLD